jgi:ABC-type glycerol-3-phosphate transport system substrate-binding protein
VPLVEAFFTRGNIAMMLEGGHWIAEWKEKAQVDWDVAALPKGPAGRGERGAMDAYLIPAGAQAPDASWQLVEAITDKEANRMRSEMVNLPPARKSQWQHWAQSLRGINLKSGIPTDSVRPDPGSYFHPEVPGVVNPIWAKLFDRNEISVADALKQARDLTAGVVGAGKSR